MQALDFARRHAWDEAHCRRVTTLALSLFDQTSASMGSDRPSGGCSRWPACCTTSATP